MKDQTLIDLLAARRLAERQAEPHQTDTSKKLVILPTHAWDKLMAATQQVLLEEIES